MKKKVIALIIVISIILVGIIGYVSSGNSKDVLYTVGLQSDEPFYENSYATYLQENDYSGKMSDKVIEVDLKNYKSIEEAEIDRTDEGVITGEQGKVTWGFKVEEAGFYNLEIGYMPEKGTNSKIERKIYLDDEIKFNGMKQISFQRQWINEDNTLEVKGGNEVRPKTIEHIGEEKIFVQDSQRRSKDPYKFYLDRGEHTIALEGVREAIKITSLTFKQQEELKPYEEQLAEWQNEYKTYQGNVLVGQAERIEGITMNIIKSSPSIVLNANYSNAELQPYHPYKIRYNTIGGENWRIAGDSIEWEVEVPETGLYQLSFTGRQGVNRGGISYRQLEVNGEVPFKEAQNMGFKYSSTFANYILGNEAQPYFILLNEGKNAIKLENVLGNFDSALTEIEESVFILNELYRKIIQITGVVPDKYIDYEISKKLPGTKQVFEEEALRINNVLTDIREITGEKDEDSVMLEKLAIQLDGLAKEPEKVVEQLGQLKNNISSLGMWILNISEMPLELDAIALSGDNAKLPKVTPSLPKKLYNEALRFVSTFFNDDTQIAGEESKQKDNITVWIGTGKDQAQVVRGLIDDSFTPNTEIGVNLELVPESVIIPATLAGIGPDVVIGLAEAQVMNFAIRNAVVDLTTFSDFEGEYDKFYPSAFEGVTYQDGIFGIPEQQTFMMMFYRQDILDELGMEVPNTWEEVKGIIPLLQKNNYDFYMPAPSSTSKEVYPSLVFQRGGDMYLGEGKEYGIESGLYSEEAMLAFKELTQFFTNYHLPVVADFSNRFRTGEMPIGLAPYTTYNQLEVFAPEIRGLWSFAPVPGVVNEEGIIDNTLVASTVQSAMLSDTKQKDAAWEFMKWWADADVQVQYANTLESIMGSAARYATANVEVLEQLPWSMNNAKQLRKQFETTKGLPEVPGGYMSTRMIDYAFKNVVTDGQNPREALYLNTKTINDELTKKREEFGLSTVK